MSADPFDSSNAKVPSSRAERDTAKEGETPHLLVLSGPRRGDVIAIAGTITIGSGEYADVYLPDNTVNRQHARIVVGVALFLADLHSTNGTWLNGAQVSAPVALRPGDKFAIGAATFLLFQADAVLQEELTKARFQRATRDRLTGVYTRRYFDERLRAELAYARRHGAVLTLILVQPQRPYPEITRVSDLILRAVARRLELVIPPSDVFARFDPDRFVALCPGIDADGARRCARRLRKLAAATAVRENGEAFAVAANLGITTVARATLANISEDILLARAEEALRIAKGSGFNCMHAIGDEDG